MVQNEIDVDVLDIFDDVAIDGLVVRKMPIEVKVG